MSSPPPPPPPRRLVRSSRHKMIAGICGGLGEYLDVDPTVVRIAYVLITVFTAFVPGLVAYAIMTFLVPRDEGARSG